MQQEKRRPAVLRPSLSVKDVEPVYVYRSIKGRVSPGFLHRQACPSFAILLARIVAEIHVFDARRTDSRYFCSRSIDLSIYEAAALAAGLALCFSIASRALAAGPEDAGFCPVISRPSVTT